jgi:hypothetical protein
MPFDCIFAVTPVGIVNGVALLYCAKHNGKALDGAGACDVANANADIGPSTSAGWVCLLYQNDWEPEVERVFGIFASEELARKWAGDQRRIYGNQPLDDFCQFLPICAALDA